VNVRIARSVSLVGLLIATGCTPAAPAGTTGPNATSTPDLATSPSATASLAATAAASPTVVEGTIRIDVPPLFGAVIAGDDALWAVVQHADSREIVRIDPATNASGTVVEGLPILPNPIHGMAVNGSLWITSWDRGSVFQYDPATGEEVAELEVGLHPIEPVLAFGDVWSLNHDGGSVSRIDTEEGTIAATIDLGVGAEPLSAHDGGGLLWVVGVTSEVWGIDPQTNTVARSIETDLDRLCGVAHIAERLWLTECNGGAPLLVDPENGESLGTSAEPVRPVPPLEVAGLLWLPKASGGDYVDTLVALDAGSLEVVEEFALGERFSEGSFIAAFESAWISGREGMVRVPASALPTR
jgi:outer membrane protein assembly factor BamB